MTYRKIKSLLRKTIGLEPAAVGDPAIRQAIRLRMAALRMEAISNYWDHLNAHGEELQGLIEEIVVPETWFFREEEAYRELQRLLLEEWRPRHVRGLLRMLSIPCSTGEEPYSMAMAVIEAGLPPERLIVDAVDISERALIKAAQRTYGRNSFRSRDLTFRSRHFHHTRGTYQLTDRIGDQVRFHHGNLLDPPRAVQAHTYDIVFCRNALIYLDPVARGRALRALDPLLAPDGVLFVATAESFLPANFGFRSASSRLTSVFRKHELGKIGPSACSRIQAPVQAKKKTRFRNPSPDFKVKSRGSGPSQVRTPNPVRQIMEPVTDLKVAEKLADAGRLREAGEICAAHLRQHGASATAFYLSGLVCDARGGNKEAADHYRKAIYLDPVHHDALMHLALLAEKDGDVAGGKRFRERARRAEKEVGQ